MVWPREREKGRERSCRAVNGVKGLVSAIN